MTPLPSDRAAAAVFCADGWDVTRDGWDVTLDGWDVTLDGWDVTRDDC